MHKVENWLEANKLKINYAKTNYIFFSNQIKASKYEKVCLRFTIGTIAEQKSVKYLGVTVGNKLSWKQHTQSVVKKLFIARGIIKLSHYAPLSVMRNVYFSIVYSHLQYAVTAWRYSAAKFVKKIRILQNLSSIKI